MNLRANNLVYAICDIATDLQNIDFSNKSCTLVQSEIGIELNSIILSSVRMAAKYLASYILIRRVLKVIYYLFTNPK